MLQFILILWGAGALAAGALLWASLYVSSRAEEGEPPENRFEAPSSMPKRAARLTLGD